MKKICILLVFLFLCTACSNGAADTPVDTKELFKNESNTLTVSIFLDPDFEKKIQPFKDAYPDVEIIINDYGKDFTDVKDFDAKIANYQQQMQLQLMSGTADDVICNSGFLPYDQFSERGLLLDLKQLMEHDPDFNKEEYFIRIFEAMEYGGGVYAFPSRFLPRFVTVNKSLSDFGERDGISMLEMIDFYNSTSEKSGLYLEENFQPIYAVIDEYKYYIDFEKRTCDFNNEDFIKRLQLYKAAEEPVKATDIYYALSDLEASMKYMFREISSDGIQYFLPYEENHFANPMPLTDRNGNIMISSYDSCSIYSGSKNKGLAWELVQYLVSEDAVVRDLQTHAGGGQLYFPTNKNAFEQLAKVSVLSYITWAQKNKVILAGDKDEHAQNVVELFKKYFEMPMTSPHSMQVLQFMIYEECEMFFNGLNTAEQTAYNIQQKVSVYLQE